LLKERLQVSALTRSECQVVLKRRPECWKTWLKPKAYALLLFTFPFSLFLSWWIISNPVYISSPSCFSILSAHTVTQFFCRYWSMQCIVLDGLKKEANNLVRCHSWVRVGVSALDYIIPLVSCLSLISFYAEVLDCAFIWRGHVFFIYFFSQAGHLLASRVILHDDADGYDDCKEGFILRRWCFGVVTMYLCSWVNA
jgi:hypothetical protein